eukprot:SAG31_NODE_10195_length_1172_cov_1.315937_2_plen_46_part_01
MSDLAAWEDEETRSVTVAFNRPAYLADRYSITSPLFEAMGAILDLL